MIELFIKLFRQAEGGVTRYFRRGTGKPEYKAEIPWRFSYIIIPSAVRLHSMLFSITCLKQISV
jgi:hypothetical protein